MNTIGNVTINALKATDLFYFAGAIGSFAKTFPFIRIIFVGVLVALDVIVTDLLIGPTRLVSYLTFISCVPPGAIGALSHCGTVHPHEPLQLEMINGADPVFLTTKTHSPLAPCLMVPNRELPCLMQLSEADFTSVKPLKLVLLLQLYFS